MRFGPITLAAVALALGALPSTAGAAVVERPVTFEVENANRSEVPCPSDGRNYTVSGHLVASRAALRSQPRTVALYLHGLGFGEFYWHLQGVPGYDFAREQARAGHASIVIDRLGYDASGHPVGTETCIGSHADTVHQMITALRDGGYRLHTRQGPAFDRVALVGHSAGSLIAQVEAYSFGEIDALVITAYADQGQSPLTIQESLTTGGVCATGGEPSEDGGAGGYAYFGQTPDDFRAAMFHDADPAVIEAATALRNRDPCGMVQSVPQSIVVDHASLGRVTVPVLVVCAADDALFEPDGCSRQQNLYSGSADVSTAMIADAGHALTLERARAVFQATVSSWLTAHGL